MRDWFPLEGSTAPWPISSISQAVVIRTGSNRQLWISGQLGWDADGKVVAVGDPHRQAVAVFENIGRILAAAGGTWGDVAVLHIYATSMNAWLAVREVREQYLEHPRPASTMVIVKELGGPDLPDFELEVEVMAVLSGADRGDSESERDVPQ